MKKFCLNYLILMIFIISFVSAENTKERNFFLKEPVQLAKVGKYQEAIQKTKELLESNKNQQQDIEIQNKINRKSYMLLGFLYYKLEQYEEALDYFKQVISIDDKSSVAYYFMGLIYETKASNEKDENISLEYKKYALNCWEKFLEFYDYSKPNHKHKDRANLYIGVSRKKSFEYATNHIARLKEELKYE